jgi:DnaK suppressor protein
MSSHSVKPLTQKQLDVLKAKLLEEKKSLVFTMNVKIDDLGLANKDNADEVDAAMNDYESSHQLRFRNREVIYAKKIDKALKKFEKEEYGLCQECAGPIRFERLLARPTAEMCILCKEESEKDESSNFFGRQSKSLGKTVDLTGMFVR